MYIAWLICDKCGGEQKVIWPWKHIPICRNCFKPMLNEELTSPDSADVKKESKRLNKQDKRHLTVAKDTKQG